MFNQAPIVAAARGTGLLNIVRSFNASVLISVMLFWKECNIIIHLLITEVGSRKNSKETLVSIYQNSKGKSKGKCTSEHHYHAKL